MRNQEKKLISLALAGTLFYSALPCNAHACEVNVCDNDKAIVDMNNIDYYYVVQGGDTLSGISMLFYGNPIYYEEIAEYNNIEDPTLIYEGQVIYLPGMLYNLIIKTHGEEFEPDETYVVQKDDVMFDIIEKYYGDRSRDYVNRVATYNNMIDPNLIFEGQEILIPEKRKLMLIVPDDYHLQYQMLEWRIDHPGEDYPDWIKEQLELERGKKLVLK